MSLDRILVIESTPQACPASAAERRHPRRQKVFNKRQNCPSGFVELESESRLVADFRN
jgi:hypothetical protein